MTYIKFLPRGDKIADGFKDHSQYDQENWLYDFLHNLDQQTQERIIQFIFSNFPHYDPYERIEELETELASTKEDLEWTERENSDLQQEVIDLENRIDKIHNI